MKKDYLKIIGAFVLVFALANILVYSFTFQEAYTRLIVVLEGRLRGQSLMAAPVFMLLAALAVMLSPFSILPFSIIAISIWGKGVTLLYVMIGSLLGASIAYLIGAQAIYRLLKLFVPADRIETYRQVINGKSSFVLVELFFLAMPVEVPGYVLGAGRYTYWKFMLAAAIAYLPFEALTIYAGEAFLHRNVEALGMFMALFVALFCAALFALHKKMSRGPGG